MNPRGVFLSDNIETADSLRGFQKVALLNSFCSAGCTDIFKACDNIHKGDFFYIS